MWILVSDASDTELSSGDNHNYGESLSPQIAIQWPPIQPTNRDKLTLPELFIASFVLKEIVNCVSL